MTSKIRQFFIQILIFFFCFASFFIGLKPANAQFVDNSNTIGYIEGVVLMNGQYMVQGWACALGETAPIVVDIYVGGPPNGGGTKIGSVMANISRENAVGQACENTASSAHGFYFSLTNPMLATFGGQRVYVNALSPDGMHDDLLYYAAGASIYIPVLPVGSTPGWPPPIYPMPSNPVSLAKFGVLPNTGNDVTSALNSVLAELAPGQTLMFSPGVYYTTSQLLVPSGVSLQGPQDSNGLPLAKIMPLPGANPAFRFLVNYHWGGKINNQTAMLDSNITITALAFDYVQGPVAGVAHAIEIHNTKNVIVQGCNFNAGNDATAMLGCVNTLVQNCLATNTYNCAYDHWDGNTNSTVMNSTAIIAGGYGILFNGINTQPANGICGKPRTASTFTAINNSISGTLGNQCVGIWVDPLNTTQCNGSNITGNITIENNTIHTDSSSLVGAITIGQNNAQTITVQGNEIAGISGFSPINMGSTGESTNTLIIGNYLENNTTWNKSGPLISASGYNVFVENNAGAGNFYTPFLSDISPYPSQLSAIDNQDVSLTYDVAPSRLNTSNPQSDVSTPGLLYVTPCVANQNCSYSQAQVDFVPLSLSCQSGTINVSSATYGLKPNLISCLSYVAAQCNGLRSCELTFMPSTCGTDPWPGVKKSGFVDMTCFDTTVNLQVHNNNTSFITPGSFTLQADISPLNASITSVAFYNGATLVGEGSKQSSSTGYTYIWNNVPAGIYNLTAVVTYNNGNGMTITSPAVTVTVTPLLPLSADGTTLGYTSFGRLVSNVGVWTYGASVGSLGNWILLNGQGTNGIAVLLLVYNHGQLYVENGMNQWFVWNGSSWTSISGDPRIPLTLSPDGTTLDNTSSGSLVTYSGVWTYGAGVGSLGNWILLNGHGTNGIAVLLLVYNHGQLYVENGSNQWFLWIGSSWISLSGDPRI